MKPWTYFDLIKKEIFGYRAAQEEIKSVADNVSTTECTECAKEPQNTPPVDEKVESTDNTTQS
jgi:hypothetical protein